MRVENVEIRADFDMAVQPHVFCASASVGQSNGIDMVCMKEAGVWVGFRNATASDS